MIKKYLICLLSLLCFISINEVKAYEFDENSQFIHIKCEQFNEIKLYIPQDQVEFISITEDCSIVNNSSFNINLYSNDVEGSFILQSFDGLRYSSNGSDFFPVVIEEVIDCSFEKFNFVYSHYRFIVVGMLFVGGCMLWLVLLKH